MQRKYYALLPFILAAVILCPFFSCSPKEDDAAQLKALVDKDLDLAVDQYKLLMKNTPAGKLPRTYDSATGKIVTSDARWWTSGFYPGTLWYLYEYSKDTVLKNEAERRMAIIRANANYTGTHDLGFMMYCSFGNAYRITGDTAYKNVLLTSARSLSTRFNDTVGCIKSWDHGAWTFPVIIDNMMNLELLCWASKNSDDQRFVQEAQSHANVTMKNAFRPDYSSYHVIDYDPHTGEVLQKKTAQGYADSSAWARGQSWALYGYTMMFRETRDSAYLRQAHHIAHYILTNPHLPEDMIPFWDYDAPGIPDTYRDVSSAAIMASAFLELSAYGRPEEAEKYKTAAEKILVSLSNPPYISQQGETGGFLLKHSVGSLPGNAEVDVPLTYADYYFVEALLRYKALK